jgi:hypothetical protein
MSENNSTETISNPISPGSKLSARGLWRDEKRLVVHISALVPARCLKCNQWTGEQPRTAYIRHFPKENILMLVLLVVAPFTVIFWKRVYLEVVLCTKHLWVQRLSSAAAWMIVIGSFVVFVLSVARWSRPIYVLSLLMLVGGYALGLTVGTSVSVHKVEGQYTWVGGVCLEYLNQFQAFVGK